MTLALRVYRVGPWAQYQTLGASLLGEDTKIVIGEAMAKTTAIDDVIRTRIREIRHARGLTQADLSKAMVASGHDSLVKNRISEIERGKRKVTLAESLAFAYVLGASFGDLTSPPAGDTVWPTPQAGFNEELWRDWLAYGSPALATRARRAQSARIAIARLVDEELERQEAGQAPSRPWELHREVLTFRTSVGTPELSVTAGVAHVGMTSHAASASLTVTADVANVGVASHAPSEPAQVPD